VQWRLDYKKHCRVPPGTYCEIHDKRVPTNTMAWWTHKGIALGPMGNLQGSMSVKFYCINTGRVLKRQSFTSMPMPDHVIKHINAISKKEGQGQAFQFLNSRQEPYEWTDEVPEDRPEFQGLQDIEEEMAVYPDISAVHPGVDLEEDEQEYQMVADEPEPDFGDLTGAALHNTGINTEDMLCAARAQAADEAQWQGPALVKADEDKIVYEITLDLLNAGLPTANADLQVPLRDDRDDTAMAAITHNDDEARRYLLRARRGVVGNQPYDSYAPQTTFLQLGTVGAHRSVLEASQLAQMTKEEQLLAMTASMSLKEMVDDVMHDIDRDLCMTSEDKMRVWAYLTVQYNLKQGLRKFGSRGEEAAVKELSQLHIMDTWTPMEASKLSREQRMRALSLLLFLKEKQMGDIKGQACINVVPQRAYIPKEDAASLTVSTESMFITATIAAKERRKVQCYDVPSAFVNTNVDEDAIMVLNGELADMMIQIAPEVYRRYMMVDRKGTKVLYVKLQKALYGLMRASLLFYRKLRKEFKEYGLVVNPYNPCVANMTTKEWKQLTLVWHVDNLMALCEDDFKLTKFFCHLGTLYGPKLSMHTGRKHNYPGVDMEFYEDGALEVSMFKYL
jgi:hypothetical protein